MILYLDTSALIKLYVEEEGKETVADAVQEAASVATSVVAYAEARAALAAMFRGRRLTSAGLSMAKAGLDTDWPRWAAVAVDAAVARMAGQFAEEHELRGYDAVHLACFAHLQRGATHGQMRFLSFDRHLTRAATRLLAG